MPKYQKQNWRKLWTDAKKASGLSDKLFTKGLGPKLEAQQKLYDQIMKADRKNFQALWTKHGNEAVKIQNIVKAYRQVVTKNGGNQQLLTVLDRLDKEFIFNMAVDKGSRRMALGIDNK